MQQKIVKLMSGKYKNGGFSVFELLIVIFLIGIIASVAVPLVNRPSIDTKRIQFVAQMNALCTLGWFAALSERKMHRIVLDLERHTMQLEVTQDSAQKKNDGYVPVQLATPTEYVWDSDITIDQFMVDGIDYFKRPGVSMDKIWFYITQSGMTQYVELGFIVQASDGESQKYRYELNPLYAQFKEKDA